MTLSVVIVIASDTVRRPGHAGHLRHCLEGLRAQLDAPALDVVVPHLPGVAGLADLARDFPDVRFVEVPDLPHLPRGPYREHHDELRSRGIVVTGGPLIALLEDHEVPASDWAARIVAAHASSAAAAVGGAIENALHSPLAVAVWLCDFARYLNPVPQGASVVASDVNVAYKREALEAVFESWSARFNERKVHAALLARGDTLALSPAIIVYQRRAGLRIADSLIERFIWGRSYGASRCAGWGRGRRLLFATGTAALPLVLVTRIVRTVVVRGRLSPTIVAALPWVCLLSAAWSFGECLGYVRPGESATGFAVRRGIGMAGAS